MPPKYTAEEARRAQNQAKARYDAVNTKHIGVKFNVKTDADIIARIQQEESVQGYIKRLIREDIARSASES